MSPTLKLIKQSFNATNRSLHMTGQHTTKCHQNHNNQALHDDPQRNLNNYLEKAEERPDGRNSIAINHLATKPTPWRVEYNGKLRKTNVFMNGIPLIANILPLYEHYVCVTPRQVHIKGFQLSLQQNKNTQNQDINLLIEIKEPGTD